MSNSLEALAGAGLIPLPEKSDEITDNDIDPNAVEENRVDGAIIKLTPYPTLVELKSIIDEQKSHESTAIIEPPSIEPLKDFLEKRAKTIEALKELRIRMAKHIKNCKISNTVGNSASIIGGILCFVFPPVGVPVLLAGSATSLGKLSSCFFLVLYFDILGTSITESVIEKRLRTEYSELLREDSLAMKICESNLKDITTWLVTVYSLGYSVSKAGVNFIKLSQAIEAASTLKTWSDFIKQLPSLASALATGAKTVGTVSGKILGISVIISVADLIQTWISKNATLSSIDKDVALLEQQLVELQRIADAYHA
jgi:hypothetical protein